jgi:NAD(P)-dependent dehydrogenase (short-subunit alcohol dehydrogenase family)
MRDLFKLNDKVAVVTGGTGALGATMCQTLAGSGARVVILSRHAEQAEDLVRSITQAGGQAMTISCDVLKKDNLVAAQETIQSTWGGVDILVNAAGGNRAEATAMPGERTFFDLPQEALQWVFDLNLMGTILPAQVFGSTMAEREQGVIINISSMASMRPLTRVIGYAAAKAAVNNLTQWLAVTMAREHSPHIRVNAIAPGFFLGEQNRFLLTNEDETLTARGQQIIDHTPMNRFGQPDDLSGALLWLASDASRFVTGIVVPVDGGFSAYSGV